MSRQPLYVWAVLGPFGAYCAARHWCHAPLSSRLLSLCLFAVFIAELWFLVFRTLERF